MDTDDFTTDETQHDSQATVTVYGETHEGLHFGFIVTLSAIYETDF